MSCESQWPLDVELVVQAPDACFRVSTDSTANFLTTETGAVITTETGEAITTE